VGTYGADYETAPDVLEAELLKILDPALDFSSFSRGVMGKYYAQATPAQREAFQVEFKATLVDLYTSALVAAKIENLSIVETSSSRPDRANVAMRAEAQNGASYMLQYNMAQNDEGAWLIRNIILDGVNIGLTYRNQFRSAMETENEDLQRVVQLWPQIIEGQ
ncbi:MAG: ABC transporter substrate-binding protein, partial [Pseudomonadota bacterium]